MGVGGERKDRHEDIRDSFTRYRAVQAEGVRIGLMTCKTCGVAVALDPADTFDAVSLHYDWHEQQ